jgi:signal peptide peptidase SppA
MSLKSILLKPVFKFRFNYNIFKPWRWNWQKIRDFLISFFLVACILLVLVGVYFFMAPIMDGEKAQSIGDQVISYLEDNGGSLGGDNSSGNSGACNVSGIELHGDLVTYIPPNIVDKDGNLMEDMVASQNIIDAIRKAEEDNSVKAIFLEIDSYGGEPVASEEVSNALKYAKKPTVALIRGAGASGAYLAATGANRIFASKFSDIGGIGVISSYEDYVRKNQQDGVSYITLNAGKFKDLGNPNKTMSAEEKNLIMRDINIVYNNFIKQVAENRKLDIKKVTKLADGSTMLGETALKNGLIDQIGNQYNVEQYLKSKIGADAIICW